MYPPNSGNEDSNADAVNETPLASVFHTSVTKIANAVIVQTNKVSIAGPNIATKPSLIGLFVFAAPCAMGAIPIPASFEKAPLLMPNIIRAPKAPPKTESPA